MKKVVSFSGGRTSAKLVIKAIKTFGPENVHVVSMDTGAEHPATYQFMRKFLVYILSEFGVTITFLRGDFNQPLGVGHKYKVINPCELKSDLGPFKEMCNKYGTPTVASAWCTSRMKEETHDKYCNDVYGKGCYTTILGIRADEPSRFLGKDLHRLLSKEYGVDEFDMQFILSSIVNDGPSSLCWWINANGSKDKKVFKLARLLLEKVRNSNLMFMAEICEDDKQDVLDFWSKMPFDLNIPEWIGNCVFCFKKSNLKLAAAQRDEPEMYIEWLEMIESAPDRNKKEGRNSMHMYRKQKTLPEVVAMFDGSTGEEIKSRIRGAKMTDSNSCSESCEVFVCEANQVDMFE